MNSRVVNGVTLVSAGIISGVGLTLGFIELVTRRVVLRWGRPNWSEGEVRVSGLAAAIMSLILGAYSLVGYVDHERVAGAAPQAQVAV